MMVVVSDGEYYCLRKSGDARVAPSAARPECTVWLGICSYVYEAYVNLEILNRWNVESTFCSASPFYFPLPRGQVLGGGAASSSA